MQAKTQNKIRVWGMFGIYGTEENPARVWIGTVADGSTRITPTTVLKIRDASGFTDEVLAGEPGLQMSF